ncbi:DUF6233 domain-containing protein [Streptomyces sp. NRRL S-813]|uniref:DUF6233 domain-containing protein n=1 Tax=Streptomyces sp. NRRL S-813 TaxID=1463919 RepID=UPI0004BF3B6A|nr:DUF6233 domain-containing protein [Streptomyces sp. NRRL S-813]
MNESPPDLPPDLPRLRTLETWLVLSLDRVRQQITAVERREAERQHGENARPPTPDWLLERGITRTNLVAVHAGDCWIVRKSNRCAPVSRDQALDAMRQQVPACSHCRPDTELGYLD